MQHVKFHIKVPVTFNKNKPGTAQSSKGSRRLLGTVNLKVCGLKLTGVRNITL